MQDLIETLSAADPSVLAFLAAVYVAAAVLSGLSGFGFPAIGALSLLVLPPEIGVALLMTLSFATQAFSFSTLWPELRHHVRLTPWRNGAVPYLVGGLVGMPVGLLVLISVGTRPLAAALGLFLLGYASWSMLTPAVQAPRSSSRAVWQPMLIGAAGGMVGGFSASPGSVLVVWLGFTGTGKLQGRALTQLFILGMQAVGLGCLSVAHPTLFGNRYWSLLALFLPVALAGSWVGIAIYRKAGDLGYRKVTLIALAISGAALLLKAGFN